MLNFATGKDYQYELTPEQREQLKYQPNTSSIGFIQLSDCLRNYDALSLIDRLVYSALRNYTMDQRYGHKTTVRDRTIALRLGISKSAVTKSLSKLKSLDLIESQNDKVAQKRTIKLKIDLTDVLPPTDYIHSGTEDEQDDADDFYS